MASGGVSSGQPLSGRARPRVREPDPQLRPVFTVPCSSGPAQAPAHAVNTTFPSSFLPSPKPGNETTVSRLTRGSPAAPLLPASQLSCAGLPALLERGFVPRLLLVQKFSSAPQPTPAAPQPCSWKLTVLKGLDGITNCSLLGEASGVWVAPELGCLY